MSSFVELCALPNPGMAFLVDVSTDRFSTILSVSGAEQKWSTVPGFFNNPSANFYGGGIASVGRLQRSLGTDGMPAAGTCSLVLDNTDGAFDWLTARSTVESTVFKARFRVYVAVFDPANPSDNQVQLAGTYIPLDNPRRDESRVFLELADDMLADAADLTLTPSLRSWLDNASTNSANTPWAASSGNLVPGVDFVANEIQPLPLAFGSARVPLLRMVSGDLRFHPHVICCTTNTGILPVSPDAFLSEVKTANGEAVPPSLYFLDRSPFNISRDGRTWRIWLVQFDTVGILASSWAMNDVLGGEFGGANTNAATVDRKALTDAFFSKLGQLYCRAFPLSSHTYPPVGSAPDISFNFAGSIVCANVARDLLQQYCRGSVIVDTPSFDSVAAHNPNAKAAMFVGDIGRVGLKQFEPAVVAETGQVRGLLKGLCSAGMFDLTALQAGQVRALANTATFEAYEGAASLTALRLDETRIVADSLSIRTPSQGQRWAPYNRVFIEVGPASGYLTPGRHGPFDNESAIATWGRPVTKVIDAQYADANLSYGNTYADSGSGFQRIEEQFPVESVIRPVVSFRYGLETLALNLGDYFILSLTRGGQTTLLDTYVDTMWKTEALNLIPDTGQVEVTAVWAGDVLADIPFLLDDETLLVVTSSATLGSGDTGGGTEFFTLAAGSFVTAGVQVGDILVLQDSAEGASDFDRNRGIRIIGVTALELELAEVVNSAATVSTWKILLGATNQPGSNRVYGKAADTSGSGVFSDSSAANKMMGG